MTRRDDGGNVCVDFVWGNFPLQPDDDRSDTTVTYPQVEDLGWTQAYKYISDTLNSNQDSHSIATTGYSNFPAFIPDYAGDGDTGLEVVMPKVVGKSKNAAANILDEVGLNWHFNTVTPAVQAVVTSTETVSVTVDDAYNLKKGDTVYFNNVVINDVQQAFGWQKLTGVEGNVLKFANFDYNFEDNATGEVWGNNNDGVRVIDQEFGAGTTLNEGTTVGLLALYID